VKTHRTRGASLGGLNTTFFAFYDESEEILRSMGGANRSLCSHADR
jgi:hypothetical protein